MYDLVLVKRCKNGDRDALRLIYEKYRDDLLILATALSGDVNVAEDAVQDTFVKFAGSVRDLRITGSLRSYLAACAANRVRDLMRANRRRHTPAGRSELRLDGFERPQPDHCVQRAVAAIELCPGQVAGRSARSSCTADFRPDAVYGYCSIVGRLCQHGQRSIPLRDRKIEVTFEWLVGKMKATRKLKQLISQSDVAVGSKVDNRMISKALSAFDESTKTEMTGLRLGVWRIIMKGRNAKLATAAIVIIAATLLITVLQDATTGPAYALDQTVEAMSNVRFMHLVTRDKSGELKDQRWIEIGMDGLQVRYRQENLPGFMVVEDGESTAVYHRDKQTVVIYDREDKQYQWVGRLGDALENLRQKGKIIEADATYEGKVAHRVWWPMMVGECFVDPQTKLPIAIGRTELSYEQPPKGIFEITIPEGYAVVDKRSGAAPSVEPEWLKDDGSADVCFTQGRHALADGEYEKAAELLAIAAEKQPMRNWAWFWLGSANMRLYKFDEAVECYSKVLDMIEDAPYALYARGLAYGYKGMTDSATEDLTKALPRMIQSLRESSAARVFEYADDPRLRDSGNWPDERETVIRMINRLRTVTGQNFGYNPGGTAEERDRAIAAWEQWFENGGSVNFHPDAQIVLVTEPSE